MELMKFMNGNMEEISDFKNRVIKVIRSYMDDEGQTKVSQDKLVSQMIEKLKKLLHIPQQSRDCIYEEFDPVLMINELVESNLAKVLKRVLEFEGEDKDFIDMVKRESQTLIGLLVEEIEDGFIEGMNDLLPFLRQNVVEIMTAMSDPKKVGLVVALGVNPVMKYIESANQ